MFYNKTVQFKVSSINIQNSNMTIWETANRPLFVRSVWLETAKTARAPQRHYILDYESREKERQRKRYGYPKRRSTLPQRRQSFCQNLSCDLIRLEQSISNSQSPESIENVLLIASSKLQLQSPIVALQAIKQKPKKTGPRRLSRRNLAQLEPKSASSARSHFSANSKLTSSLDTKMLSKCLAERVLNWLDLAVKFAYSDDTDEQELEEYTQTKDMRSQICNTEQVTTKDPTVAHIDAMKCVSIVFDRDLHAKQTTLTQNIKSTLKMERFNKSADVKRLTRIGLPQILQKSDKSAQTDISAPPSGTKRQSEFAKKSGNSPLIQDVRRQLHIFLPAVPDKNCLLEANGLSVNADLASTLDSASGLSSSLLDI